MDLLVRQGEPQFEPCALLRRMAERNEPFYKPVSGKGDAT
jgi:hypothetical protein